jgi:hypothetical protein
VDETSHLRHERHVRSAPYPGTVPGGTARLASATDLHAELLGRPQLGAALFALDRERGGKARAAAGTLRSQLAAALRALGGQLVHVLLEVTLHEAAAEAERDPIAERLAPLLLQPVPRSPHEATVARPIARVPRDGDRA